MAYSAKHPWGPVLHAAASPQVHTSSWGLPVWLCPNCAQLFGRDTVRLYARQHLVHSVASPAASQHSLCQSPIELEHVLRQLPCVCPRSGPSAGLTPGQLAWALHNPVLPPLRSVISSRHELIASTWVLLITHEAFVAQMRARALVTDQHLDILKNTVTARTCRDLQQVGVPLGQRAWLLLCIRLLALVGLHMCCGRRHQPQSVSYTHLTLPTIHLV